MSRAYSSLETFVTQSRRLLAPEGRWVAMKGAIPHDEVAALAAGRRRRGDARSDSARAWMASGISSS